ncbi:hypothetical protein [Halomontanus rarus]|uniref:hypothetical protein n=1 Tax=Halomontanus rarus TaxID=3034020 RepID=UPI0023E8D9EF|nr:hypothetical protein [Halovivax sp. TS33]
MQVTETREVACPQCGENSSIPVPERDVELKVSPYVAAFGDHAELECSNEHTFWVYYC